jgi:hypothetical protein
LKAHHGIDRLTYYATPGPLTTANRYSGALAQLPTDLGDLAGAIHGLGIYDVVARDYYGVDVPDQRADEIHLRTIDDMLAALFALDASPLTTARPPQRRILMRCGGFTRLLVSALRAHGIPARARCGFAAYFNPGHFEDHWVGEVWDSTRARWRLVDAQLDEVWRARLNIDDDVLNVDRDRFLTATDAWHKCRTGAADPVSFGISFASLFGMDYIAGSLIRDLAALNRMEMLPWDVWGAQPPPDAPLESERQSFFDDLAALTSDPDASFAELRQRYESDDRVRVPRMVTNAIRGRPESVAGI